MIFFEKQNISLHQFYRHLLRKSFCSLPHCLRSSHLRRLQKARMIRAGETFGIPRCIASRHRNLWCNHLAQMIWDDHFEYSHRVITWIHWRFLEVVFMADGGCHTFFFGHEFGMGKKHPHEIGGWKKRCDHIFQAALQLNFAAGWSCGSHMKLWSSATQVVSFSWWWFHSFTYSFIFIPTWRDDPIWLILFKWVETTNQLMFGTDVQCQTVNAITNWYNLMKCYKY